MQQCLLVHIVSGNVKNKQIIQGSEWRPTKVNFREKDSSQNASPLPPPVPHLFL